MAKRFVCLVAAVAFAVSPAVAGAGGSGGGGGNVETIKVTKCYYAETGGYVELLISATSSNSAAALYAFLPDGELLGQVFSGGRYGGTVFLTASVPDSITIISTLGASITVPCLPFQP